MPLFPARHCGNCGICEERLEEDDLIGYVEDEVVCEDCYVENTEEELSLR